MTRYGVLSDVHANLPALEVALAFLSRQNVDSFICAGDLVGYGPHPNECVQRVLALPGVCVAGNHDLIAIGAMSNERCDAMARFSLAWTSRALDNETRTLLAGLPCTTATPDGVLVTHGTVDEPREYVRTTVQALTALDAAQRKDPNTRVLVLGHTHHALAVRESGETLLAGGQGRVELPPEHRHVINPGAVGQSREHRRYVRVGILDLGEREACFVTLHYNDAALRTALRHHGLPRSSHHCPPRPRWRVAAGRWRGRWLPRP